MDDSFDDYVEFVLNNCEVYYYAELDVLSVLVAPILSDRVKMMEEKVHVKPIPSKETLQSYLINVNPDAHEVYVLYMVIDVLETYDDASYAETVRSPHWLTYWAIRMLGAQYVVDDDDFDSLGTLGVLVDWSVRGVEFLWRLDDSVDRKAKVTDRLRDLTWLDSLSYSSYLAFYTVLLHYFKMAYSNWSDVMSHDLRMFVVSPFCNLEQFVELTDELTTLDLSKDTIVTEVDNLIDQTFQSNNLVNETTRFPDGYYVLRSDHSLHAILSYILSAVNLAKVDNVTYIEFQKSVKNYGQSIRELCAIANDSTKWTNRKVFEKTFNLQWS